MKTFLFRLESTHLCTLQLSCRNQRPFLGLYVVMPLLYFIHALVGNIQEKGELIPFIVNRRNGLKLDLTPI